MAMEDFDKPIEMAFLEEGISEETFNEMNCTQQYIYTSVRVLRNKLKIAHLNELIEAKLDALELTKIM